MVQSAPPVSKPSVVVMVDLHHNLHMEHPNLHMEPQLLPPVPPIPHHPVQPIPHPQVLPIPHPRVPPILHLRVLPMLAAHRPTWNRNLVHMNRIIKTQVIMMIMKANLVITIPFQLIHLDYPLKCQLFLELL